MTSALLISDLHLEPGRPDITAALRRVLEQAAARHAAVYILGDLFEAWVGDDDDAALAEEVRTALRALTGAGVATYFMAGNRDFLVGEGFAGATGVTLLSDPTVHELGGEPTLLMHGDTLCTADTEYQALREQVRDPAWQQAFLAQPLAERRAFAEQARAESAAATAGKDEGIMDVTPAEVQRVMAEHGVRRLIHGHTHRPASHQLEVEGAPARRIVLGAWHERGWSLVVDDGGAEVLEAFPLGSAEATTG